MKVLFYPDPPVAVPGHTLSKTISLMQWCGFDLTNNYKDDWVFGVYWNLKDKNTIPTELLKFNNILNIQCTNVLKSHVALIYKEIFGVDMTADTGCIGVCVEKSEAQSKHDGRIIERPCERKDGKVYHKLIDNRISPTKIRYYRILIIFGKIFSIVVREQDIGGLFEHSGSTWHRWTPRYPSEVLSKPEIINIKNFCLAFGLDIGDIDVLRHSDGQLYIVDVNNMPGSLWYNYTENAERLKYKMISFTKSRINERFGNIC